MICLDKKKAVHQLMDEFEHHNQIIEFLKRPNLSALDIGCGYPQVLCALHHDYKFKTLQGVDARSESQIVSEWITKTEKFQNCKTIFDIYKEDFSFPQDVDRDRGKTHLTQESFNNVIKLELKCYAENFWERVNDQFDFLILSNILPLVLPDYLDDIFNKASNMLLSGGLVYLRCTHPENPVAVGKKDNTFSDEKFKMFTEKFTKFFYCKNLNDNGIGIESQIFLGFKN